MGQDADNLKATALTNTFGVDFQSNGHGLIQGSIHNQDAQQQITTDLTDLGLKAGTDFIFRGDAITIRANAVPDAQITNPVDNIKALGYAHALESQLGIHVRVGPAYSPNHGHAVENHLIIDTGNSEQANDLSMKLANMRLAMGIDHSQMPINYKDGVTSFSISAKDIELYDQSHGVNHAFFKDFSDTLKTTEQGRALKNRATIITQQNPELAPQTSGSSISGQRPAPAQGQSAAR